MGETKEPSALNCPSRIMQLEDSFFLSLKPLVSPKFDGKLKKIHANDLRYVINHTNERKHTGIQTLE
jgi:hypothetical protein